VFILLQAATYEVLFHHFVRLIIRAAYIFYLFKLSKGIDDFQPFLGCALSTKLSFRIPFSSALPIKRETCWYVKASQRLRQPVFKCGSQSRAAENRIKMASECFQLNAFTSDYCDLKIEVFYFYL